MNDMLAPRQQSLCQEVCTQTLLEACVFIEHRDQTTCVSQRLSGGPPPLRLPKKRSSSTGSPQHRIGRMTNHSPPATSGVIYSSFLHGFQGRGQRRPVPSRSLHHRKLPLPWGLQACRWRERPDAKRDQAQREQHGGKQGGKRGGHPPEKERHPEQYQQRRTRCTAHWGGQPCRQ